MSTSALLLGGYFALLSLVWGSLIWGSQRWGEKWRLKRPPLGADPKHPILVSVCIPARDEAANIGMREDRAGESMAEFWRSSWSTTDRLTVRRTRPERPGVTMTACSSWTARSRRRVAGKPWACRRAVGEARGQILCFVDADVRLAPDAIAVLVDTMVTEDLRLLGAYGTWELHSFWERTLIPAVGWLIRGAVDLDQVNDPGLPVAFANGQLIAVERNSYDALDGHGSVRSEVLEDVRLAEQFKCRGHRVGMRVAPWAFHVRLYEGLGEIIRGYTKNLYEGMGRRPSLALGAILFIFVGALLPWLLLGLGLIVRVLLGWGVPQGPWLLWCGLVCVLQVVFRWMLESRDGRSGWSPLLTRSRTSCFPGSSFVRCLRWRRPGRGESSSTGRRKIQQKTPAREAGV